MTTHQIEKIYQELVIGKVILLHNIDHGYGDVTQTFIRYSSIFKELRYEVYNLHGNGEELVRTESFEKTKLSSFLDDNFEKVKNQLGSNESYPWLEK